MFWELPKGKKSVSTMPLTDLSFQTTAQTVLPYKFEQLSPVFSSIFFYIFQNKNQKYVVVQCTTLIIELRTRKIHVKQVSSKSRRETDTRRSKEVSSFLYDLLTKQLSITVTIWSYQTKFTSVRWELPNWLSSFIWFQSVGFNIL